MEKSAKDRLSRKPYNQGIYTGNKHHARQQISREKMHRFTTGFDGRLAKEIEADVRDLEHLL